MNGKSLLHSLHGIDPFELAVSLVCALCVMLLFAAVAFNFLTARHTAEVQKEKKSPVATLSMTLFFLVYCLILGMRVWIVPARGGTAARVAAVVGALVVVLGCAVNLRGRHLLGRNWGDAVRIYHRHTLVTDGIYRRLRHPLYASTIWMLYGGAMVYGSVAAAAAVTLVFVPFMAWRARQEERLLAARFPEYEAYRGRSGMFFPALGRRRRP